MKNMFKFKMTKVAGIVLSVVMGLGAVAPVFAATEVGTGLSAEVSFVGGTFVNQGGSDTYNETSEGVWVNTTDATDVLSQSQIDGFVANGLYDSYDAGTEFVAAVTTESGLFADTTANATAIIVERDAREIADLALAGRITNETISAAALSGNTLTLSRVTGGDLTIDLSAYADNTVTGLAFAGETLTLTFEDSSTSTVDLSNFVTGAELTAAIASGTSSVSSDLTTLTGRVDANENAIITAVNLTGDILTLSRVDGDITVNLDGDDNVDSILFANDTLTITTQGGSVSTIDLSDYTTSTELSAAITAAITSAGTATQAVADALAAELDGSVAGSIQEQINLVGAFETPVGATPQIDFVPGYIYGPLDSSGVPQWSIIEQTEGIWLDSNGTTGNDFYADERINNAAWNVSSYSYGVEFAAAVAGTVTSTGEFGEVADAINDEEAARIAADVIHTADIAANTAAISAVADNLVLESARLDQAILDGDAATLVEATARIATARADLEILIRNNAAAIVAERTARLAADAALQTALNAEVASREAADVIHTAGIASNAADLVNETAARIKFETTQAIVDAAQNGRLDTIEGILVDHESRISALEGYHSPVDKSFSKVIVDDLGRHIVMHFDADGTQRGKPRFLTFLENPVFHGEDDVMWNEAGVMVNAITGLPVDENGDAVIETVVTEELEEIEFDLIKFGR